MLKIIKPTKANVLAVPFGVKIAKTIEIGIKIKKGPAKYRLKNKNPVKNIEMKPKYSLIVLSLLKKWSMADYIIEKMNQNDYVIKF
ncbi:Uncharacterized protein BCRIVMBC126_02450 [Bacillus wiedmannii]|nr:hypothetical protein [Bacillus wiedmannii]SCN08236.1 Uncharacterized protein BCRIVMBC126_02450 [Bacillus wiedmannii]